MTAETLLIDLHQRGIRLILASDGLRCRAPRGVVTTELHDTIKAQKPALVALLTPDATLPDEILIPTTIPNNIVSISACIDAQRINRRVAR
jgi:TubC N-terminal docking domain